MEQLLENLQNLILAPNQYLEGMSTKYKVQKVRKHTDTHTHTHTHTHNDILHFASWKKQLYHLERKQRTYISSLSFCSLAQKFPGKTGILLSVYGCSLEGSQNIIPLFSPCFPLSTGPLHIMGYVFRS